VAGGPAAIPVDLGATQVTGNLPWVLGVLAGVQLLLVATLPPAIVARLRRRR